MSNTQKRQELAAASAIATLLANLPETGSADVSATEFREALSKAITPVTILATDGSSGRAGVTCSAVCSVCDTPPTILVCVNRNSFANGVIKANGILTVNWLSADQSELSQLFAGVGGLSMPERFAKSQWGTLASGAPYCKEAMMTLDCHVADAIEVGTHSLIFARVIATTKADERHPLAYYQRAYATTHPAPL
ncbi:flavin reductase [Paraburkholderia sp. BL10I2N1]|uniref:flavin reductase n=1 Tax=Paraburkholderia sp. BL10I2N1 TaxID=1938796 RepID=UPI00105ED732|nr:flavin reductase [Paraburkholderia sp. BL10I2N1]TDN61918.1 flavin reductase (NADH)/flavin reductase/chlorophenol-4-monooxygenase component 1 [Paraburkholderia sp. BL10I2N1]